MLLAADSGSSRFSSFISPNRFSLFDENVLRVTTSFAVSIVSDSNLQFFVVSAKFYSYNLREADLPEKEGFPLLEK